MMILFEEVLSLMGYKYLIPELVLLGLSKVQLYLKK